MITWKTLDPNKKLVDVLNLTLEKDMTLDQAAKGYLEIVTAVSRQNAKTAINALFLVADRRQKIGAVTVKEANTIFKLLVAKFKTNVGLGYKARAILPHLCTFAANGEVPTGGVSVPSSDDIGKLVFRKALVSDIQHLVPLYSMSGRFGWLKAEVQKMIFSLEAGDAGLIEVPSKRSMDEKESKALMAAVTAMFKKGKFAWVIKYNPNESTFIVMRQSDFEKIAKGGLSNGK